MFVLLSAMRLQLPTLDPMRLCNCEVVRVRWRLVLQLVLGLVVGLVLFAGPVGFGLRLVLAVAFGGSPRVPV